MERCAGDLGQFVTTPRTLGERTVAKLMRQVCGVCYMGCACGNQEQLYVLRSSMPHTNTHTHTYTHADTHTRTWVNTHTHAYTLSQLAGALVHVHSRGYVHLDVKPANVLLTANGNLRLGDFGSAARVPSHGRRCTPLFAAPEVIATGDAGCAADAWSYGILVYTMMVGFPPCFIRAGGNSLELEQQVCTIRAHTRAHALVRGTAHEIDAYLLQICCGAFGFPTLYWRHHSLAVR